VEILEITFEALGACRLLAVVGEVDLATSLVLEKAVEEQLEPGAALILDMTAVTFLDSFGIRILLGRAKAAAALGARLTVIPSDAVARVFELTGMTSAVIETAASRDAARVLIPWPGLSRAPFRSR
jgi:anti-sigma B factor antagonist